MNTADNAPHQPPVTADQLIEATRKVAAEFNFSSARIESLHLDSQLDQELGLDSLTRAEFFARIESRLGTTLPQHAYADIATPRDLLAEILRLVTPARNPAKDISRIHLDRTDTSPSSAKTLIEVLDWHLQTHPDRTHIQLLLADEAPGKISYRELCEHAQQIAAGLQQDGLKPRQCVAIMLPTSRDYFFTFFGILIAGGIPVPIYPPARMNQLEDHLLRHKQILSNCKATFLVTIEQAKPVARLLKTHVPCLHSIVTPTDLYQREHPLLRPATAAEDIAFLQYTSGSTGFPKGVVLTHANLLTNIRTMGRILQVDSTDTFVSWLPLYHDMGLIGAWFGSFYHSSLLALMSPLDFLVKPERWLQAIDQTRATLSAAPNFAYELCLKRVSDETLANLDLGSVRALFNGAEPVSANTMQRFAERFEPCGLKRSSLAPVYGLAECSLGLTFPPLQRGPRFDAVDRDRFMRTGVAVAAPGGDHSLTFVSCGAPIPDHELRIVDESGRELPDRHQGRLQFRGPSTTRGYFRNPQKTRELFEGDWLNSGDLAYVAEGEVYLTGRKKDLIIHAGRNIYPQEIEEKVSGIPGIRKGCVAVFGSTDPASGTEKLIVLAETRETGSDQTDRLRVQVNEVVIGLTGSAADEVVLAPPHAVLKTSSGKIRRSGCRELYEQNRLGASASPAWLQYGRLLISGIGPQFQRLKESIINLAWAGYAWIVFLCLTVVVWPAVVLNPVYRWRIRIIRRLGRALAWMTATRISVCGQENLPSGTGPCVLVSNHCSYLDAPALMVAINIPFVFVAKHELVDRFIARTFLRKIATVFVHRNDQRQGVAESEKLVEAINSGKNLLIFPEGTFTRVPGLRTFYSGAFKASHQTGATVVPVIIHGTRSILRADSWFPRRGAVSVTILPPLDPRACIASGAGDQPDWKQILAFRDGCRNAMLAHAREPDLSD